MKKLLLTIVTLVTTLLLTISLTSCGNSSHEGKLIVGFSPDYAPYEFVDLTKTGDDQYVGADIELAKFIANELGLELVLEPSGFNQCLINLQAGKIDLAISGFTYKEDRAKTFEMSTVYYDDGEGDQVVVTTKANLSKYASLSAINANGVIVGAQAGSVQYDLASTQLPNATVEQHVNISDMITYLEAGKLHAVAMSQTAAEALISTNSNIVIVDGKFEIEDSGLYVLGKKGNTELMAKVNEAINKVQSQNLYQTWMVQASELFESLGDNAGQPDLSTPEPTGTKEE